MRYHVALLSIIASVLAFSLVCCSIARGQALDFKVDGPTEKPQGEMVHLIVMFPEGFKADVDFTPVDEPDFSVDPIIEEDATGQITLVGRKCSFSTRCLGARTITVVASGFAIVGDGVPRLKNVKHTIQVTAKQGPKEPPTKPPTPPVPPDDDDDLGPWIPLPGDPPPQSDMEKVTVILDNVMDRLEALEKEATAVSVKTPAADPAAHELAQALVQEFRRIGNTQAADEMAKSFPANGPASAPAYGAGQPASVPVVVKPAPVAAAIVDARPGHWSVGPDFSPNKSQAIAHLRNDHPSKARQHEPLESLSLDQVLTLHDDAHEGRASASRTVSASPVSVYTQPIQYGLPAGGCPGGVCPTGYGSATGGGFGPLGLIRWRR